MKTKYIFLFILPILLFTGCKKKTDPVPTVETYVPQYIASKTATLGVRVTSSVKQSVIITGVYIGTSPNPDVNGVKFQMGSDTGLFIGQISGLTPNKKYYVKGYVINNTAEVLGSEINFTTPPTVSDNDLNDVETVIIGDQTWMAKNLRSTHYRNGDVIGTTTPVTLDISSEISPVYMWFANGSYDTSKVYGVLYTWYAVTDTRNICPLGWHIPTDAQWSTLEDNLGGYLIAGSLLKEYGNNHWLAPYNTDASNISCFTALPAGYRPATGTFALLQNEAHFWSATESETSKAWERSLSSSSFSVSRQGMAKNSGLSVRCIKD
jgi:uncharacterized protein (TIGR02145 family)